MSRHQYMIFVPTVDNDGIPFEYSAFKVIEDEFIRVAGGFTAMRATGKWCNDSGIVFEDTHTAYILIVPSTEPYVKRMSSIKHWLETLLRQEQVFIVRSLVDIL